MLRSWGRLGAACALGLGFLPQPRLLAKPPGVHWCRFQQPGAPLKWGDPILQIRGCPREPQECRNLLSLRNITWPLS